MDDKTPQTPGTAQPGAGDSPDDPGSGTAQPESTIPADPTPETGAAAPTDATNPAGSPTPGHASGSPQPSAPPVPPPAPNAGWSSPSGSSAARDPWTAQPTPPATPANPYGTPPARSPEGPSSEMPGQPSPHAPYSPGTAPTTQLPASYLPGQAYAHGGSPPPPGSADGSAAAGGHGSFDGSAFAAPPSAQPTPPAKKRRAGTFLATLAVGAIIGGGAGAATVIFLNEDDSASSETTSSLDGGEDSNGSPNQASDTQLSDVGEVADQLLPSVVSIQVSSPGGSGGGSGVIISSDGQILTNNHVVQAAAQGQGSLTVSLSDGSTTEAEVVGTDPMTDLAVLQAQDVSDLTPAELGTSDDVTVGQQVVAIGSPLGLEGTVTTGIVSALDRTVEAGSGQGPEGGQGDSSTFSAIQTDAPINPGNSGGPLVNMAGEVVGINSAILTTGMASGSIGLGFSIPIDQAAPIAEELVETGEATHAQIGVTVGNPQDGSRGALVAGVTPNTAAAEAGLQEGDIVTGVDDRIVNDGPTLVAVARSYRPGDEVTLTVQRDDEEITVDLTLGSDAQTT